MKVISPLEGGGQEVILTLIKGGCNFILRPTLLILEPLPPPDNYCTVPKIGNIQDPYRDVGALVLQLQL